MKMITTLLVLSLLAVSCTEGEKTEELKQVSPGAATSTSGNTAGAAAMASSDVDMNVESNKIFYAMGVVLGSSLQKIELNDMELSALYKGLVASAKSLPPEVDMRKYQPEIQKMIMGRMKKQAAKVKEAGKQYLTDYLKKNSKAKQTKSGLVYEVLKEGKGKKPLATDTVEVHYHGTLTNGTVFDSSVDRGQTISFPLNRVIKGWTEGLQLVKEGGKVRLVIPSELGYGDQGAPPKIPGGATLVFEVELFKINPEPKKPAMPKAAPKGKK